MSRALRLVELARSRVGEAYCLGYQVPYADADFHAPPHDPRVHAAVGWDCAELATWAARQVCGELVGVTQAGDAYSGAWATCAQFPVGGLRPVGEVYASYPLRVAPELAAAVVGAILVRAPGAPGRSGHVAISAGAGRTVEAYSTDRGVIESSSVGRRWDLGVFVPWVDYQLVEPLPLSPPKVLRRGSVGEGVARLQQALGDAGYPCGLVDGLFGPRTASSVVRFQLAEGLLPDGEVGPLTAARLRLVL